MDYMVRALELAVLAKRICKPNPAVGAVLVRDGVLVGEGFTQPAGHAHAEVMALRSAGADARGATLYVTLEPCSHQGRTAPCVAALLDAGVGDVHAAMLDPSPWVNGRGVEQLRSHGIGVTVGEHDSEARQLNKAYFTWVEQGRPLVTAIWSDSAASAPEPGPVRQLSTAALEALYEEADRVLVDRSGAIADSAAWTSALKALAGQSVQHVIVDAPGETIRALYRQGLVDALVLDSTAIPSASDRPVLSASRRAAITLHGLVACLAGS